jgi:predicted dehydrogenase
VYLEKPIAASFADGQAIVDAWRRAGTVGRIGFNCRFNALYREMHDRLAAGDIGAPVAVRTALTACWPSEEAWRLSPTDGGGALLELASHHVDLLRFLFEAEIVHVTMASWSNRGIDEAAMLQLQLASGLHVQTLICYGTIEEDHFAVYGGEGKLVIDRYNSLAVERAPLEAAGGISSAVRRLVREIARLPYGWRKRRAPGQEPSFASSLAAFVTSVRDCDSRALPSLEDGLAALAVIDAARIAAKHPNGAAAAASR